MSQVPVSRPVFSAPVGLDAAVQRLLGPQQLAFVRCWAEGLDLSAAWNRYMYVDGAADARRARGELQRLLDRLRGLARAHGRPEIAALLRRDPEAMPQDSQHRPTLDEFRELQPPDFYSEAELLRLYEAEFGTADSRSPARRRQRLRERLVLAVQWLAGQVAREPRGPDRLQAWLDERVAARLAAVGLHRLDELAAWIGRHGFHWHRGIPRLGPAGAARIVRWLREHEASLGPLPRPALLPAQRLDLRALTPPAQTGIVPLERLLLPAGRDGSCGSNRAPLARCKLAAANDHEAVQAWLRLRVAGTHTWRAYRKEAERFLLWSVLDRRKALSSLDGDDCVAYRDFLAKPGPQWTGRRGTQRWSADWRPFEGPLSPRSAATALTVVRTLCEWLVRRHYLDSNPWDDVPARPDAPSMPQLRALSQRQWQQVQAWLAGQPPGPATQRLRFILTLAYTSGMRLAELSAARLGWLRLEALDEGPWVWSMMVLGKRAKWREVPLPESTVESFREYLTDRGLSPEILSNDPDAPVIARLGVERPLSTARIYEVLVQAFGQCAASLATQDRRAAERIRQASTHWLRHTHGSHAAARGVPQDVLQANLGHASLATTSIYVTAEKGRRHRAVEAAFGAAAGPATGAGRSDTG